MVYITITHLFYGVFITWLLKPRLKILAFQTFQNIPNQSERKEFSY